MKNYTTEPGKYPNDNNKNSDEFFGNGWSVKKENQKCILTYISGSLQGELKTIEISELDYYAAKEGKITIDELCIKYHVS